MVIVDPGNGMDAYPFRHIGQGPVVGIQDRDELVIVQGNIDHLTVFRTFTDLPVIRHGQADRENSVFPGGKIRKQTDRCGDQVTGRSDRTEPEPVRFTILAADQVVFVPHDVSILVQEGKLT